MAITPSLFTPPAVEPELLVGDSVQPGDPRYGLVWINPERMSGAPCFYGTRVPVQSLFDYFVDGFSPITREHVLAVLELAKAGVLQSSVAP
jgi:uncharacterized protein (DUF433 family)